MFTCTYHYSRTILAAFLPFNHDYWKATDGDRSAVHLRQHSAQPQRTGRAHDHEPAACIVERSCDAKLSLDKNCGQDDRKTRRPVPSAECWYPSAWGSSSATYASFVTYPISTSPTVTKATPSSLASATLHKAPATRRRRGLCQRACTSSLGSRPRQHQHHLRQQGGAGSNISGAGQLQ